MWRRPPLCALAALLGTVGAGEELVLLGAAPRSAELFWLPRGAGDPGPGQRAGVLPPGSAGAPRVVRQVVGSKGHAFRLRSGEASTPPLVHEGGGVNLVGVAGPSLDSEVLGPGRLQSLVLGLVRACLGDGNYTGCCHAMAKTPRLGIRVPADIVDALSEVYSPLSDGPQMVEQGRRDALFVLSTLPYPVDLQWAWLADESYEGSDVPSGEGKLVGRVPAASPSGTDAPYAVVTARGRDTFFATAPSTPGGAPRRARAFSYPGELFLAVLRESPGAPGELAVDRYDEDALKLLLAGAVRGCAEGAGLTPAGVARAASVQELGWGWEACLRSSAKLPSGGALLPPDLAVEWFAQLWRGIEYWLLCSFQAVTEPVATWELPRSADGGGQGGVMRADVLRTSPLVVAVHALATPEECASLRREAAGDLGRAPVSGGASRDRRALSKGLYPAEGPGGANDTVTRLADRFFEVARQLTGYELHREGQEPAQWLVYKPGYEYRPHCDGDCGEPSVVFGDRMATSLLYCAVADEGGGTVFTTDGLKVEPTVGMMLLFTYNPDPQGLSRHAACPVLRGEKATATQWYREGVSKEHDYKFVQKGGRLAPRRRRRRGKREREEI